MLIKQRAESWGERTKKTLVKVYHMRQEEKLYPWSRKQEWHQLLLIVVFDFLGFYFYYSRTEITWCHQER